MNKLFPVSVSLLLLFAGACGGGEEAGGDSTAVRLDTEVDTVAHEVDTSIEEESAPDEPDTLEAQLELCYATSIGMPESLYGPENAFDGDSTTYWLTMPGAAPDEGIYLSFEEPQSIRTLLVETLPEGPDIEGVNDIQVYLNGVEGAVRSPGTSISNWGGGVKSIFVKIVRTESMYYDERGIRYQRDLPVGISEIRIYAEIDGERTPIRIVPLREAPGSVTASSSLEPSEAYGPDFLFDSRTSFGWADGNEGERGVGESLRFSFDQPQRIERIKIWNGYHRSRQHFAHNERASLIAFGPMGGEALEIELDDTMEPQEIFFDQPLQGTDFSLEILDIYPGEVYRDLVISELRFNDGDGWFALETGSDEELKDEILEWAGNTDAAVFIDRQIYDGDQSYGNYWEQSLVIRSNGSFVIWKEGRSANTAEPERMYADGNWQILDDNTIRIFGRLHRLASYEQQRYDPYAGTWSDQEERLDRMTIISDTLRFGRDWISSSRGLFEDFSFQE